LSDTTSENGKRGNPCARGAIFGLKIDAFRALAVDSLFQPDEPLFAEEIEAVLVTTCAIRQGKSDENAGNPVCSPEHAGIKARSYGQNAT
jgi:hypothetical protein